MIGSKKDDVNIDLEVSMNSSMKGFSEKSEGNQN
jgi:hypothetical protein